MTNINNFENLLQVSGRNFDQLKQKLLEIKSPARILEIGSQPTGIFYAILMLDRPVKRVPRKKTDNNPELSRSDLG